MVSKLKKKEQKNAEKKCGPLDVMHPTIHVGAGKHKKKSTSVYPTVQMYLN